jgi:isoleucyl-tRNA synthetase
MPKVKSFRQPPDLPKLEKEVQHFWEDNQIFEKSVEQRPADNSFVFYDGPPFATGLPHYGHLLASTIKDVIPRFQTMLGKRVERRWGWDCHGLPLENLVEKELGIDTKREIEEMGVEKFNETCRSEVLRYADEWKQIIPRLGRWIDMENDYKTMDRSYMESVWWVFKQLWDKGLVYHGHKPMHICPRCGTPLSNFEVNQGYENIRDLSVMVKFKLKKDQVLEIDEKSFSTSEHLIYLLAWTTTPWTLPGNNLLAVDSEQSYVLLHNQDQNEYYACAEKRLEFVLANQAVEYQILGQFKGEKLLGMTYEPVFDYFADLDQAFQVVAADFVSMDEGTGIVHVAPGFGEDDYYLGQKMGLKLVQHVNREGKFTDNLGDLAGLPVKPKGNPRQTDEVVAQKLKDKGLLFKQELVEHSYPHCWRCDTPLLNYATDSWFVKVTEFKEQLIENNEKINWVPAHMKHGRFGNWLEDAVDWAVSRDRYWGTPLPIWQSEDGDTICVGSAAELEELTGQKVKDLHKHLIDELEIEKNGKVYKRIPQVFDCWFESGSMPYGQYHYPFEEKDQFKNRFPAQFIAEGADQTRGWFYTLHVLATALSLPKSVLPVAETTSAFENVVVTGIILASDGKKMSKRLHNYPDPMEVINKYGADSLRLYLMQSPVVKSESLRFNEKEVAQLRRQVFLIWWNMISFYKLFTDQEHDVEQLPQQADHVLDQWLLSRLNSLTQEVTKAMKAYDLSRASRLLIDFVNQLSTWYLRLSRDRIKNENNQQVSHVLGAALYQLAKLYAPFTPFFAELVHHNLIDEDSSIHLSDWPQVNQQQYNQVLEQEMSLIEQIVEQGRSLRRDKQIKLRHPLASLKVSLKKALKYQSELEQLLLNELNVKAVYWSQGADNLEVDYDYELTPALKQEAEARDLIRSIQNLRRKAKLDLDEEVEIELPAWPEEWRSEIESRTNTKLKKGDKMRLVQ